MADISQIKLPDGTTYNLKDNQPAVLDIPNTPSPIATFSGAANLPLSSLKVAIEPVQDLHGYDAPWVGGSGKNKLPLTVDNIKALNGGANTWNGNTKTINDVTFTILTDAANNVIGINANGTANGNASLNIDNGDLSTYQGDILNGCPSGGSVSTYRLFCQKIESPYNIYVVDTGDGAEFPAMDGTQMLIIRIYNGYNAQNVKFYPMIRVSTESSTFAPYSNICPISGWDEVDVTRTGKNLIPSITEGVELDSQTGITRPNVSWYVTDYARVEYGKTYYLSGTSSSTACYYDKTKTFTRRTLSSRTITPQEGEYYVRFNSLISGYSEPQLEEGTEATSFSPFGATYTIDLDGTRYGGKLDLISGVLTVDRVITTVGDLNWSNPVTSIFNVQLSGCLTSIKNKVISSGYSYGVNNFAWGSVDSYEDKTLNTSSNDYIYIKDTSYSNATDFKTAMSGIQLAYELATPLTIQLTPTQVSSLMGVNNVWADCGQITEGKYVVSKYDGITAKISEVAYFAKTANKQVPEIHRKYESTSYYATTATQADSTWYFMSVKPDDWYKPWKVKFKVHTYCPNYPSYESITWSTFTGREQSLSYANFNERYDSAHYYISAATLKKAGFDAGYGHALGVSILYGGGYTTAAYYRTFEVDYYECENCTVTILDSPTKLASWNGYSSTNYNNVSNYDAINRGLRETSDDNDGHYYSRRIYSNIKAGSNKIFPYTLIMQNADGRWESLVTSNSTGTSKTRNTHGFRLNQILYMSANATYNENIVVGTYAVNEFFGNLLDHRYSFNTANDSTNGTTANTPIYLVGSINATDGLFYLDTKWWTQTLPTSEDGKLYIYIGDAYDYYRMIYSSNHPIYWYKGGKLQEYSQSSNYAVSAGSATSATTASKLGLSNVGSATQPIYLSAGTATACTYTLGKSVPSDAKFTDTDTKNTAGSTDTSSKIFLIGATSQAANPQTYSDNEVYTTSGVLTTKSVQVGGGSATMEYDSTTQSINFIFN